MSSHQITNVDYVGVTVANNTNNLYINNHKSLAKST